MKNSIFVFFSLSIVIFFACQKETPVIKDPCDNAYDLRSMPYDFIYKGPVSSTCNTLDICNLYPDSFCYYYPRVNPNNAYEICFIKEKSGSGGKTSLYKFDFCSNKVTFIAKIPSSDLDWSKKDWIVFTGGNGQIWKIKSNGDSLIQLTNNGSFYDAKWSISATKLLIQGYDKMLITDENGNIFKKIPFIMTKYDWFDENTIIYYRINDNMIDYFEYTISTEASKPLFSMNREDQRGEISIDRDNRIVYVNQHSGLYQYNLNTKKLSAVSEDYGNSYNLTRPQKMGTKILYWRFLVDTLTKGVPCCTNFRSHIAIMNLDGTNERQVLLPE